MGRLTDCTARRRKVDTGFHVSVPLSIKHEYANRDFCNSSAGRPFCIGYTTRLVFRGDTEVNLVFSRHSVMHLNSLRTLLQGGTSRVLLLDLSRPFFRLARPYSSSAILKMMVAPGAARTG